MKPLLPTKKALLKPVAWSLGAAAALLAGLALVVGCQPDKPAATGAAAPPTAAAPAPDSAAHPLPDPPADPAEALTSADAKRLGGHDTLRLGPAGPVLRLRPQPAAAFAALPGTDPLPAQPDKADNPLGAAASRVRRNGENLVLWPETGPAVTLHNVSPDTAIDQTVGYYYWGALPGARQWVVSIGLWEGSAVLLVDQRNGRQTTLWGPPTTSPDNRYLLALSCDLEAAYNPNGLQLFTLEASGPRLLGARGLTYWGPGRVRWTGARTVLVERQFAQTSATPPASAYAELRLPAGL